MKKSTIKAFTLVEMLIVIVIIGILISALMPRMQAAQWRARDVARKTALSQIQSAIVVSQWDKWEWPGVNGSGFDVENWAAVSAIKAELTRAWLNSIPVDPLKNDEWDWLGGFSGTTIGDYGYMVTTRNGSKRWWFVLMAKTEVEWGSNWVVCSSSGTWWTGWLSQWYIKKWQDLKDVHPCDRVTYEESGGNCVSNQTDCIATSLDQLRYILMY